MGCSSSKQTEIDNQEGRSGRSTIPTRQPAVKNIDGLVTGIERGRRSTDSGISLNESKATSKSNSLTAAIEKSEKPIKEDEESIVNTKGVAYDIPIGNTASVSSRPPKRFTSYMESRKEKNNGSNDSGVNSDMMKQISQKQMRAEQLRDQERLLVVTRQKKREARARKVIERRNKLQEFEMADDEDFSEFEVDANFNDDEDYDFATDECVNHIERNMSYNDDGKSLEDRQGNRECESDSGF